MWCSSCGKKKSLYAYDPNEPYAWWNQKKTSYGGKYVSTKMIELWNKHNQQKENNQKTQNQKTQNQ